jgi:hypothetical protein
MLGRRKWGLFENVEKNVFLTSEGYQRSKCLREVEFSDGYEQVFQSLSEPADRAIFSLEF